MKIIVSNQITVRYPTSEFIDWCDEKLSVRNPEYIKNEKLGFSNYRVPEYIRFFECPSINEYVLPFGLLRKVLTFRDKSVDTLETRFPEPRRVNYHSTIKLYDYQEIAVKELMKKKMGILESKAGSGKTQMGLELIARLGMKALWITHTRDLLNQSKERAAKFMDESLLGEISNGKINIGNGITFATVQTLAKQDLRKYVDEWDIIVVDECHRVCGTPEKAQQFSYILNSLAARRKYGLSATVHRSDGLTEAIFAHIGNIAYSVPEKAVKDKIMEPTIVKRMTNFTPSKYAISDVGVDYQMIIKEMVRDNERNRLIVNDLVANKNHSNLILSTRLSQLKTIMNMLPKELQEKATLIDGKMVSKVKKVERSESIQKMRDGELNYLFATYGLAKEGLDITRLDRLYMALPQNDYAVVIQSVGRIARVAEGKEKPICYDYVDDHNYFEHKFKKRKQYYWLNKYDIEVLPAPSTSVPPLFAEKSITGTAI